MAIFYKNISSIATTTLITKGSRNSGGIRKITIANHDNSDLVIVKLYLDDGSTTYTITETTIPPLVTLVLEDNLSFDSSKYDLKMYSTGTAPALTVIIK